MYSLRQGFQPVLKSDHSYAEAHGIQAIFLYRLWTSIPAEGGPSSAQGDSSSREPQLHSRPCRNGVPRAGIDPGAHRVTHYGTAAMFQHVEYCVIYFHSPSDDKYIPMRSVILGEDDISSFELSFIPFWAVFGFLIFFA